MVLICIGCWKQGTPEMRGWMAEWYVVATDKWQLVVLSLIVCWSMPYTIHMYVACSAAVNLKTQALPVGWLDPYAVHNTCYVVCYVYCPNPILCRCLLMLCIFQVSVHMFQPGLSLSEPSCFLFCLLVPFFFCYLPLAFSYILWLSFHPKSLHIICPIDVTTAGGGAQWLGLLRHSRPTRRYIHHTFQNVTLELTTQTHLHARYINK